MPQEKSSGFAVEKFTGKSVLYKNSRPGYPAGCYDFLMQAAGLQRGDAAADIGAGTGIFSRGLLERGLSVYAVEPNADMRREAEKALAGFKSWHSLTGTAEHTGLPRQSVKLVTAAQAFHWFEPAAFRDECRRILRPDGFAALVWNHRDPDSPLVRDNAAICRRFCPEFSGFSGGTGRGDSAVVDFFHAGEFVTRRFPHDLSYTLDGFVGRNLSSSYAPRPGDAGYQPFVEALQALFHRYEQDGRLRQPNVTCCYIGRV